MSLWNNLQRSVNFDVTVSASGVLRLFEGGAYSSKYAMLTLALCSGSLKCYPVRDILAGSIFIATCHVSSKEPMRERVLGNFGVVALLSVFFNS